MFLSTKSGYSACCKPLTKNIDSDQVYCCHGGISQYATSLDHIAAIERPTHRLNNARNLREALIFSDTVWADPWLHPFPIQDPVPGKFVFTSLYYA
ncbi:unnamed protein product [Gongylonema pulchrum]|uniref:Metallophos domain-containing protein n=1 Tax=Gongylonema pulchrum TaxID=637853 RepID=A0A3P6Q7S4_9BILA|nr:unnamed protein product [Gongylonema pulchrum]